MWGFIVFCESCFGNHCDEAVPIVLMEIYKFDSESLVMWWCCQVEWKGCALAWGGAGRRLTPEDSGMLICFRRAPLS